MISVWAKARIWALGKAGAKQALDGYLTRLEMAATGPRSRLTEEQQSEFLAYLKRTRARWLGDDS